VPAGGIRAGDDGAPVPVENEDAREKGANSLVVVDDEHGGGGAVVVVVMVVVVATVVGSSTLISDALETG